MRLSAAMIVERLAAELELTVSGKPSTRAELLNLLLAEPGDSWAAERLYLADGTEQLRLPEGSIDSTLLVRGSADEKLSEHFSAVVSIPEAASVTQVHNLVQEVFAECNKWEADIHRILSIGSDVQAIIDISGTVFNNPLVLIDGNYKALAYSAEVKSDPAFAPVLDAMALPFLMTHDNQLPSPYSEGQVDIATLLVNGMHAYATSLSQHKYKLLLIEHHRLLSPSDALLLKHLSNLIYLAVGFIPEYVPYSYQLSESLKRYMNDASMDEEILVADLKRHGWLPEHSYVCLKFHAEIFDRKDRSLRFFCERVATVMGEDSAFEYQDSVVAVINFDLYKGDEAGFDKVLREFLQDNFLKVGISNRFTGFTELRHYYTQAALAIATGPGLLPLMDCFSFRDVIKPLMKQWCTAQLPAQLVCAPEVLALDEYDRRHDSELTHTLYVLLKNNLNYTRTAKELFIHRSTLNYRLGRIQKITALDLENIESQWYILLSLELLRDG